MSTVSSCFCVVVYIIVLHCSHLKGNKLHKQQYEIRNIVTEYILNIILCLNLSKPSRMWAMHTPHEHQAIANYHHSTRYELRASAPVGEKSSYAPE